MLKIHEDNYEWIGVINQWLGLFFKVHPFPIHLPLLHDDNKVKINTETVNTILNDIVNNGGKIKVLFSPKLFSFGYLDESVNHQGSWVGNYLRYLDDDWEMEHDVFNVEKLSVSKITDHIDRLTKAYPNQYLIAVGYHQPIPDTDKYWEEVQILAYNSFDTKAMEKLGKFII